MCRHHSGVIETLRYQANLESVMPAEAGIQVCSRFDYEKTWIPVFTGMTKRE
jgi:hypothetical protein